MSLLFRKGVSLEVFTASWSHGLKCQFEFDDQDAYWVIADGTLIHINKSDVVGVISEVIYV